MRSLHYTQEEIDHVGLDAVNYQGVGCPHRHVDIEEGNAVLDLGSGLGVDSLIATKAVGPTGRVVGIDISGECVQHANRRAKERGVDGILEFVQSPIERIPVKHERLAAGKFDVIISNGAFCLLPNKMSGFEECCRLLKSGGKIALCTTVIKDRLEDGVEWPLCMRTFAKMNEIIPMLEKAGFVDIELDLSDSVMEVYTEEEEVPGLDGDEMKNSDMMKSQISLDHRAKETDGEVDQSRFKVHNGDGQAQFKHLENFDMNQLCARVVIKARKP
jgi:Methylase involved in ubiquinone/menaquinone biosynthesis